MFATSKCSLLAGIAACAASSIAAADDAGPDCPAGHRALLVDARVQRADEVLIVMAEAHRWRGHVDAPISDRRLR